jgi:hypothetical protein
MKDSRTDDVIIMAALLASLAIYIAGETYAVGESDRICSVGSCQIVAVFSEIFTLAMQVSVDMNSSVKYLSKPVMQKSKYCN